MKFKELYKEPSRNGLTKPSAIRGTGIKFCNMGELFANSRIGDIPMELVPVTDREMADALLEEGDLLFARQSLVREGAGQCSVVTTVKEPTTFDSHLIRVRLNQEVANPLFYQYFFSSHLSPIPTIVTQCAQSGIRGKDLAELNVLHLPIGVQNEIAETLSRFDLLIENNRKQIKLLEEAAQRLYKEWFIELRFPGYENTEFDPETGLPEGWALQTFDDVCESTGGGTPSTSVPSYWENGTIPWVTPSDVTNNTGLYLPKSEKCITQEGLTNSSARLLPKQAVLMTSRASIGHIAICDMPASTNQGFISCIPRYDHIKWWLVFELHNRVPEFKLLAKGSTFLELSRSTFRKMKVILPSRQVLESFSSAIEVFFDAEMIIRREIDFLIEARDRLLPELMEGKVVL